MTIPYDRNDRSTEAGMNMRWLIIKLLDDFRINGRYPWSRNPNGNWWYPEVSEPLMRRWYDMERGFMALDANARDAWIRNFTWQF